MSGQVDPTAKVDALLKSAALEINSPNLINKFILHTAEELQVEEPPEANAFTPEVVSASQIQKHIPRSIAALLTAVPVGSSE